MEPERQTRKKRIDPKQTAARWQVACLAPGEDWHARRRTAVEEFETANGPADYALCDKGSVLGVVEAKRLTVGPDGVLTQAARYSRGLAPVDCDYPDGYGVPFLYSTNGERILFHDTRHEFNRSRDVSGFHTLEALREMLGRDSDREITNLRSLPKNPHIRPYQSEASEAIEDALAHRKRKMLVTMATGTGKTRVMVNEAYRLMKSGVARRVLAKAAVPVIHATATSTSMN